ncbi:hypothetical protein BU197_25180 [Streptomyces sp. CBMA291]|nr:hypothetical protein [Streptomyces sp. CBMA291]MBD0716543.1 hypothetical protein [Streptomyces sp. CBMA370]
MEMPGGILGSGETLRLEFADGVLRAVWEEGDTQKLTFTGTAVTSLAQTRVCAVRPSTDAITSPQRRGAIFRPALLSHIGVLVKYDSAA